MLDKTFVRKLNLADCQWYRESIEAEMALTNTRIERLKTTQAKNPTWEAYDKYADDWVDIDIRIEEQQAVLGMLEDDIRLIREREEVINIGTTPLKSKRVLEHCSQLVMRL